MPELQLTHPVHTLEGVELLPAGTVMRPAVWDELLAGRTLQSGEETYLMGYGTIRRDILDFIKQAPYETILGNEQERVEVLKEVARVRVPPHLLAYFDFFKDYDLYTYFHILKVFVLSTRLAEILAGSTEEMRLESAAGPLHDLGKACIPLSILNKTSPLSSAERKALEHHSAAGYVLLGYHLGDPRGFFPKVAKEHHERRDGSGYPLGIKLSDSMVEIITICDIYDALLSPRPYQPTPYDNRSALEAISDLAREGKLSWEAVKALVSCNRQPRPDYRELTISEIKRGAPPEDSVYGITAEGD